VVGSLVALKEGDAPRAEDLAHDALRVSASFRVPLGTAIALDRLGAVAADLQSFEEAARLFAAARAIRDRTGAVWLPFIDQSEGAIAATRAALDAEAFDAAWAEGEAMSVEDAVAYAQRGRGERKRPSSGWASLTPAELQVVRLVAEGLSNKQIGQRLYVETATVKTHLVHVYAKVGLSSRTELATEAVRRSL
jgi:DNA-binding CsgD family transcriptional regulator